MQSEKAAAKSQASLVTSSSQVTIEECLERLQPLPNDHPTARKITILIGEMMALDCQPFSIVEDQGFVSLLNQLQPHYKIPSRKYFLTTLIPELYAKCNETVEKILQSQKFVALTSDIWSSRGHDSVISFTAHFITDKFVRRHCLLQASKFNERHTGDNIALMFVDCICQWEIQSKIVCVLPDGGANFVAGFNSSSVNNLICLAYNLQRVIHDGVLAQRDVQDL